MAKFNLTTVTDGGKEAMQSALENGYTMTFTRLVVGNGVYAAGDDIKGLTELRNQKNAYSFSSIETDADGSTLNAVITNNISGTSCVDEAYNVNEIGIYVTVNDEDYLYAVAAVGGGVGAELPAYTGDNSVQILQEWYVSNSNEAEINIDASGAYATQEQLKEKADRSEIAPIETSPARVAHIEGDVFYFDEKLYKATKDIGVGDELEEGENIEETRLVEAIGGTTIVMVPVTDETSFTYNGGVQGITFNDLDTSKVIITGGTATDAGDYIATVQLKDSNMIWSDMTVAPKTYSWSIEQATPSLSVSPTSIEFDKTNTSAVDIVISTDVEEAPTVSGYDTNIVSVSGSGMTYTVTPTQKSGNTSIMVSLAASTNYKAVSTTVEVTAKFVMIYGASWDGTSTTLWSRTDAAEEFTDPVPALNGGNGSSPFDECMPWSGMVKEERTGGTMVKIPKFWYKITQNGNGIKIQIAEDETEGFSVSPAHMDRGDGKGERDAVYVGRYHCGSSSKKSKTGESPYNNVTRPAARSALHNLGSNLWQIDFATRFTIWLLYIVEFANWNSQAAIGYGCGNNSGVQAMGYTDSMTYHTGTTQSARTTYGLGTQYRYIEGLWDNVYDWLDGCYYNSSGLNIILNPNSFSDSSGGTVAGLPTGGYPSKFSVSSAGGFPLFYPTESSGSDSTYSCDSWYFNASDPCLYAGGYYSQNRNRGLFYVDSGSASGSDANLGCRLLELP